MRRRKSELVPRAGGRSRHAPRTAPPATAQSPGPSTPGFPASAKRGAKEGAKGRNVSTEQMKGRLAIKAATMNLSGQSVMGLTPAYKLNYIRSEAAWLLFAIHVMTSLTCPGNTWRLCRMSSSSRTASARRMSRRSSRRCPMESTRVNSK